MEAESGTSPLLNGSRPADCRTGQSAHHNSISLVAPEIYLRASRRVPHSWALARLPSNLDEHTYIAAAIRDARSH